MTHWKLLGALLAGMLVMQVGLSLRHSLWADEVFSLAMATGHSTEHPPDKVDPALGDFVESETAIPALQLRRYAEFSDPAAGVGRVLRAVKLSDTSPPLYYVLLHGWCRIWGTSDLALRMFSILCSLACVPLLFALGREMDSEKTGTIAAVLFGMTPMSVYYSSEGRMYSLLWLCLLGAAYATVKLYRGAGWRWEGLAIATFAAGLLTHYYFVFPTMALGVFSLWRHGASSRWRVLARFAVVGVLVLPWYSQLPQSLAQWRITQDWVHLPPPGYNRLRITPDLLVQYFSGFGHYLWVSRRILEVGALGVFAVAAGAALWRWRTQLFAGPKLMLPLWFLAAALGPLLVDVALNTYIAAYPRYSSAAMPAACLLGAVCLSRWRHRVTWSAVVLIGACWAPSVAAIFKSRSRCGQQNRDVAKHISSYGKADDLILVHSIPTGAIALARYTTSPGAFATWIGQLGQRQIPESLAKLLTGRRHVYLVKIHTVGEPAPEEGWLRENAKFIKETQVGDAFITEFEPRAAERF